MTHNQQQQQQHPSVKRTFTTQNKHIKQNPKRLQQLTTKLVFA